MKGMFETFPTFMSTHSSCSRASLSPALEDTDTA
jgi:hypothetical protein